jgi:GT2 family glycosyltransferase
MEIQADLSICTTVFRNAKALKDLLSSLYQTAGSIALEVIAVDRTGVVASLLEKEFPQLIVYEDTQEKNPVKALNRGLKLASGRYLSVWDNDVRVKPACLQTLLDFLDENPDVGLAGPKILNAYGQAEPSQQNFPSLRTILASLFPFSPLGRDKFAGKPAPLASDAEANFEVECLQSGVHIIRRELFEEIGFFDPSFSWTLAELDYYWRGRRAGWHNFFCSAAESFHLNPARYHQELRAAASYSALARDAYRYLQKSISRKKNQFQHPGF